MDPDDLDTLIVRAMAAANTLSAKAKEVFDMPTMYSANHAWRTLFEARKDLENRRSILSTGQQS